MSTLDLLLPEHARDAAHFLDRKTMALRWLVAFLQHLEELPEESRPYWRLLWNGVPGRRCAVAHSFHNGTTYVCGEEHADWIAVEGWCREDLLPERIVGDRFAVEAWERTSPEAFARAERRYAIEVLAARGSAGIAAPAPAPAPAPKFRAARPDEVGELRRMERMHSVEIGLEVAESDFETLVEAGLAYVLEADGGTLAGCVSSNVSDGTYVHIGGLYVLPEWRGRAYGRLLAEGVAEEVATASPAVFGSGESGESRALADVYEENEAALRAYREAGYEKVGEGLEVRFGEDAWS